MNLENLFLIEPQLASVEDGAEPCLEYIIHRYYAVHGVSVSDANKFTDEYMEALHKAYYKMEQL